MSALLRKVKSTIHAPSNATDSSVLSTHDHSEKFNPQQSRPITEPDAKVAVENPKTTHFRPQRLQQPSANVTFRQRLTRKASTLSLRARHRRSDHHYFHSEAPNHIDLPRNREQTPPKQEHNRAADISNGQSDNSLPPNYTVPLEQPNPGQISFSLPSVDIPTVALPSTQSKPPIISEPNFDPAQVAIREKQAELLSKGYITRYKEGNAEIVKMAPASAAPPVPYARLQEITVAACEKALASVTTYAHTSTEEWNTTIINTILGGLVQETTPTSSSPDASPAQPPFKYVVNSTIIQHAPASTAGAGGAAGRRGMHAASGAYWNNEKDGMWSYKYSAAEKQGLDVVIGIIWLWGTKALH